MRIFLAGGAVRDILLGLPVVDRDYLVMETSAREFEETYPQAQLVGRAFPVYLIDRMEFSFPRAATIREELESRDLTVNALLLDEEGELHCHPKGLDDLNNKILRPASDRSFLDDPLRVFRAARFWARFPDFTPHESLIRQMREAADADLLKTIAPDRVGQETIKAISSNKPGNYLRLLNLSHTLQPWLEEISRAESIPAGPPIYHDTNVLEHTCRTMDALAGDPIAVWMGLCHDLGKTITPEEHHPTHHNHDRLGVSLAETLTRRLRMSNTFATVGAKAARWHMVAARYDELRPGTRVDLLMDLHHANTVEALFKLVTVDQDKDFLGGALRDLKTILNVSLPRKYRNLGPESGKRLRELRAGALRKNM